MHIRVLKKYSPIYQTPRTYCQVIIKVMRNIIIKSTVTVYIQGSYKVRNFKESKY